jgi:hypothetical protein
MPELADLSNPRNPTAKWMLSIGILNTPIVQTCLLLCIAKIGGEMNDVQLRASHESRICLAEPEEDKAAIYERSTQYVVFDQ